MGGRLAGAKTILGGLIGGVVLFVVGFLFWGTPLAGLAYSHADDATNAQLQAALAQGLTRTGTGTYMIPWPTSDRGTVLFGQGPVATVHFNTSGFAVSDPGAIISGLMLALITGLLIAIGLGFAGVRSFAERARLVVLLSVAATMYLTLAQPILNHQGWGYWLYSFVAGAASLSAAGLVIARWFLPNVAAIDADATRH